MDPAFYHALRQVGLLLLTAALRCALLGMVEAEAVRAGDGQVLRARTLPRICRGRPMGLDLRGPGLLL